MFYTGKGFIVSEESIGEVGTFWGVAQGMETLQIQWEGKFQHLPKVAES